MGNYNPFVKAIFYSIVLFAVIHLAFSFFYGIIHGDTEITNMFHILGLDLAWPNLGSGKVNGFLGVVMTVSVWAIIGCILQWRDGRADKLRKATKHHKEK